MSSWPSSKAKRVLSALYRIGWQLKRQSGSHKTLSRAGWSETVAAIFIAATDVRAQDAKECLAPLPCGAGSSCPTLSEAMRDAEESVRDRPYVKAGHGTCANLKYVYQNSGRGSGTL